MKLFGLILFIALISPVSYGVNMSDCEQLMLAKEYIPIEYDRSLIYKEIPEAGMIFFNIEELKTGAFSFSVFMPQLISDSSLGSKTEFHYENNSISRRKIQRFLKVRTPELEEQLLIANQDIIRSALKKNQLKYIRFGTRKSPLHDHIMTEWYEREHNFATYVIPRKMVKIKTSTEDLSSVTALQFTSKDQGLLEEIRDDLYLHIQKLIIE